MRNTIRNFGRKALVAALPLAVASMFASAGTASATAPEAPAAIVQAVAAPIAQEVLAPQVAPVAEAAVAPVAPQADATEIAPVAAEISQPQDIATDPNAKNHDPIANAVATGAAAGAIIESVFCAVTLVGIFAIPACAVSGALEGALIGLIVGAVAPDAVPQVLP
ncbi:hypothetical protein JMUB6875_14740 [Nocardia sp. JMUB6875]|uniref:hypothetical protein n=1 Tax=Nocardia sp. JMUB6875 TaxID=3158170 RepID=UPI0032E614C5